MIKLNVKKTEKYIPLCDRELDAKEQTVFHLAPLTVEQESEVRDAIFSKGTTTPYNQYAVAFRCGVVDIENLIGADGTPVKYKYDESIVSSIPRSIRDEVGLAVLKMLERSEEEAKN